MTDIPSVKLISKLNRQTKEDEIIWHIDTSRPSSLTGTEVLVDNVYECLVLGKRMRLYKLMSRFYHVDESYEWTDEMRLELIDMYGKTTFQFPPDPGIRDLYQTVMFKTSGVEGFLDEYLGGE
jgi:hypothetical protein